MERGDIQEAREEILNVRSEIMKRRSRTAHAIDSVGTLLARPATFLALLAVHAAWVGFNLGLSEGARWDPPPHLLLATIASSLAPFIALLILMRQHRDARVSELREEIELQVALRVERDVTQIARLLDEVRVRLGLETALAPAALDEAKQELDAEHLLELLEAHLDRAEGKFE